MTVLDTEVPAVAPEGYVLERHLNALARHGCWYVKATGEATGGRDVLIGWIGRVTDRGPAEGDGWSALSFCARDADSDRLEAEWWRGRVVWGDAGLDAQAAMEALLEATDPAWLDAEAQRPEPSTATAAEVRAAARADYSFARQGFYDGLNRLHGR